MAQIFRSLRCTLHLPGNRRDAKELGWCAGLTERTPNAMEMNYQGVYDNKGSSLPVGTVRQVQDEPCSKKQNVGAITCSAFIAQPDPDGPLAAPCAPQSKGVYPGGGGKRNRHKTPKQPPCRPPAHFKSQSTPLTNPPCARSPTQETSASASIPNGAFHPPNPLSYDIASRLQRADHGHRRN